MIKSNEKQDYIIFLVSIKTKIPIFEPKKKDNSYLYELSFFLSLKELIKNEAFIISRLTFPLP